MKVKDKNSEDVFGRCDIPFYLTTVQGIDDHFNGSIALDLSGEYLCCLYIKVRTFHLSISLYSRLGR